MDLFLKYKDRLFLISGGLMIVLVIFFLDPVGDTVIPVPKANFTLKTFNVNSSNPLARFDDAGNGVFLVVPGEKAAAIGEFTFQSANLLSFHFRLEKRGGSERADPKMVEFRMYQNTQLVALATVDDINSYTFDLKVGAGDKVKVVARALEEKSTAGGQLEVRLIRSPFAHGQLLAGLVWLLFYLYLYLKKHKITALISFVIFVMFLFADNLYFGKMLAPSLLSYCFLIIGVTFFNLLLYQILGKANILIASVAVNLVFVILCVIPGTLIVYYFNFGAHLSQDSLIAIFQTNTSEALEFLYEFLNFKSLAIIISFFIATAVLTYWQGKIGFRPVEIPLLVLLILVFTFTSVREIDSLRIVHLFQGGYAKYTTEVSSFKDLQNQRKLGKVQFEAKKTGVGETYIVVIGESLNKGHMGLYGYHRHTTPELSELKENNRLLVFNAAFSTHTHTQPVLQYALTEANQVNQRDYFSSPSIFDILKSAGFETYWLSNQVRFGLVDNMVSVIAASANHLKYLNKNIGATQKTSVLDDKILPHLNDILSRETNKNRVIFIHLMGNHGWYCSRFPESHQEYSGELKVSEFGHSHKDDRTMRRVNCYDNSIRFNDYVIGEIIRILKENTRGVRGALYFSDHAEDVLLGLGHHSDKFTYAMTQIPLVLWLSEEFIENYSDTYKALTDNLNTVFSTDFLYDTMLGIFGVSTSRSELKFDLSSGQFRVEEDELYTLYGKHKLEKEDEQIHIRDLKRKYSSPLNLKYHQAKNISELKDRALVEKVIPQRVNSIGKLNQVLYDGYKAFEVDLLFREDSNGDYFEVAHDEVTRTHMKLADLLDKMPVSDIAVIWLDIKNIDESNADSVLERLTALEARYKLKEKIIVATGTRTARFSAVSDSGYNTAYHLQTRTLVEFLKNDDQEKMHAAAQDIAKQVATQKMGAVSFDSRIYPFVKNYLEPLIDGEMVYYTLSPGPKLTDPNFIEILDTRPYLYDPRVKIVSVPYYSEFSI